MVPADFFDDVLDAYGMQRHFGCFPRERAIKQALHAAHMEEMFVGALPTPWVFSGRDEAAWFVHELFGLGVAWSYDTPPKRELRDLRTWCDRYLGFYEDSHGRTFLYWQLGYFVGRKPETSD